jgi:hypothetical protein
MKLFIHLLSAAYAPETEKAACIGTILFPASGLKTIVLCL